MNQDNLFLILKAYLSNPEYIIRNIYTITKPENEKIVFLQCLNKIKLSKSSFSQFGLYYSEFIENDEKYVSPDQAYGIRISFFKTSPALLNGITYPKYPWDLYIYKSLITSQLDQSDVIAKLRKSLMRERYLKIKYLQCIYTRGVRISRKKIL